MDKDYQSPSDVSYVIIACSNRECIYRSAKKFNPPITYIALDTWRFHFKCPKCKSQCFVNPKEKLSEVNTSETGNVVTAYKYSKKGFGPLYEAIILQRKPCLVTWYPDYGINNKNIEIKPFIDETTRIIRPPNAEEYPYTPYNFADEEELNDYFSKANTLSLNDLYQIVKGLFEKYVDQDLHIMTMLSADSIFTWFQDLFPITHYCECIGGNDAGKSSIGFTFGYTAYRPVRGTAISGANYYRILGNVEPGQCTIIEDEADNISEDSDKIKILKAGYELDARVPKTNMNTKNQVLNWFFPYCFKMILAEKSLSLWKAKGLVDRTFTYQCRPGKVGHSIKNVVSQTINKKPALQKLYDELLDFQKLMLCYRLIHYTDELPDIKTSVTNRNEELSSPLLQLFYGTEAFEEIKEAIEFFLSQRKQRRSRSLEAALHPILKDIVDAEGTEVVRIPFSIIWGKVTSGEVIKGSLYSDNKYETNEYGPLYQNTLSKFICDKFSCYLKRSENGSTLIFEKQKFNSYEEVYGDKAQNLEVKMEVQLVNANPDCSEGTDACSDGYEGKRNPEDDNLEDTESKNKNSYPSNKPSEPSEPPAFPPKCYYCDLHDFESKSDYESHCVVRHPRKPGYPNHFDIKVLNLLPQTMSWEI